MKRSREKKNEVILLDGVRPAQTKKRQKIASQMCVFDWLPDEMMLKILEAVPWQLDGILRAVHSRWRACIQQRWELKRSLYWSRAYKTLNPCIRWAMKTGEIHLLQWFAKVVINEYHNGSGYWMETACGLGNAKTIAWLASKEAPKKFRGRPDSSNVSTAARHGDLTCYKTALGLAARTWVNHEDAYQACIGGQLETVQYILSICGCLIDGKLVYSYKREFMKESLINACKGGSIQVVDWFLTDSAEEAAADFMSVRLMGHKYLLVAVENGQIALAAHLVSRWKCHLDGHVFQAVMSRCKIEEIRWLISVGTVEYSRMFGLMLARMVKNRHFDILNLLVEAGWFVMEPSLMHDAVLRYKDKENVVMLQWLWDHSCFCELKSIESSTDDLEWTYECAMRGGFETALSYGDIKVLDWFNDHGFIWYSGAYRWRHAKSLYLKCQEECCKKTYMVGLRWLHQHGLVDLSQARILANGKIWWHTDCHHWRDKKCLENTMGVGKDNLPWWREHVTGKYLIPRT